MSHQKNNTITLIDTNIHVLEELKSLIEAENTEEIIAFTETKKFLMLGNYTVFSLAVLLTSKVEELEE